MSGKRCFQEGGVSNRFMTVFSSLLLAGVVLGAIGPTGSNTAQAADFETQCETDEPEHGIDVDFLKVESGALSQFKVAPDLDGVKFEIQTICLDEWINLVFCMIQSDHPSECGVECSFACEPPPVCEDGSCDPPPVCEDGSCDPPPVCEDDSCEPPPLICQASLLDDRGLLVVVCGEPINEVCWVGGTAGEGVVGCESLPDLSDLPAIDENAPVVQGQNADIPGGSCVGKWGSKTANNAGAGSGSDADQTMRQTAGEYDAGDDAGTMDFLSTGEAEVYRADSLAWQSLHGSESRVPHVYMPGATGGGEPGKSGAGIGVSLVFFLLDKAIDNTDAPDVKFPTRNWYVDCSGQVDMLGKCNGAVLVEERQCVLVTAGDSPGEFHDIPGTACNYHYLPEFPTECWAALSQTLRARAKEETSGAFSDGNRELPMTGEVCWDEKVWILNRPYNDPHGVFTTIENVAGFSPYGTFNQQVGGDCYDGIPVAWDSLTWTKNSSSCPGNIGAVCNTYQITYTYDPNSGSLESVKRDCGFLACQ